MAIRVIIHQVIDKALSLACALIRCREHLIKASRGRATLKIQKIVLLLNVPLDLLSQHLLLLEQQLKFLLIRSNRLFVLSKLAHIVAMNRLLDLLSSLLSRTFLGYVRFVASRCVLIA